MIVAYVGTQYTRKPLAAVKGEIDTYLRFYPDIQGIHFDEQSSDAKDVGYFAELYHYVHQRIPEALVLNNPGVPLCPRVHRATSGRRGLPVRARPGV